MEQKRNWLALLVVVVLGMALGIVWYSVIFQAAWMEGNGIVKDGSRYLKHGVEMRMTSTPMMANMLLMILYAILIEWLLRKTGARSWKDGSQIGLAAGVIQASGLGIVNVFAHDPVALSFIDGAFAVLLFLMYGAILGGWTKKQ